MQDLWATKRESALKGVEPLAVRMRPRAFDEFAGQAHIVGSGRDDRPTLLRRMIAAGRLTSILLHGPPGTGKTTLAEIIARHTGRPFVRENAATIGVKRIREIVEGSRRAIGDGGRATVLILDEIHRFSRAQQDALLEDVERGIVTLIGVTTENPLFAVNAALVSRSTLFRLEQLTAADVADVVRRAIADEAREFGKLNLRMDDDAIAHWAQMSDGDARRALNALEVAVLSAPGRDAGEGSITIDLAAAEASIQHKAILYDRDGDQHYDHASALIKSLRGSDPDAALYWLAVMLEAGEDPRFIARRLAILASEDIGNADPRAIMVADAAWSLVERIGMPEARITLGQCVTYLALAPKSNASYTAINDAMADVREGRTVAVPMFLRDKTKAKSAGSAVEGKGYEYSHNASNKTSVGGVTSQDYLGVDKRYYTPTEIGFENFLAERLDEIRRARGREDK
ncbi:MAG: replication-associated recombination protein A [Phycisphaeraceae bacterium]|nr:replication-associated recombination protein A [Phycisphaerales bacterium]MCB9843051.1 replication-associated recombination protein A [Phycisphaeraceae bacterium]